MARRRTDGGSAGEARRLTREHLSLARQVAEPAATAGDFHGSYEAWACAFRLVLGMMRGAKEFKASLQEALDAAEELRSPEERAAALRATAEPLLDGEGARPRITFSRDEPLRYVRQHVELAIQIGAPSYNAGDHKGCYEFYACTARLMQRVEGAAGARGRLRLALEQCAGMSDPDAQAWTMRHGFDDVLSGEFGDPVEAAGAVRDYLAGAIRIGAPAFESGDQRGCYEVYACTARLIMRTVQGEEAAKGVLREALTLCATESDLSEQARVLRRAFDRIVRGD
jgi:hypothetical protein